MEDQVYMALTLNRKFNLKYIEKNDIFPLTRDAKDIMDGKWMK